MHRAKSNRTGKENHQQRRGLTLFEVLLSLAIFTAALAAIGQLVFSGVRGSVRARLQTEAVIRCQSKLAELIAVDDPLADVTDEPFDDDPAWTWSIASNETDEPGLMLLLITVGHHMEDGSNDMSFSISRMYRDPLASLSTGITDPSPTGGGS